MSATEKLLNSPIASPKTSVIKGNVTPAPIEVMRDMMFKIHEVRSAYWKIRAKSLKDPPPSLATVDFSSPSVFGGRDSSRDGGVPGTFSSIVTVRDQPNKEDEKLRCQK